MVRVCKRGQLSTTFYLHCGDCFDHSKRCRIHTNRNVEPWQCDYFNRGHLEKVDQSDCRKITIQYIPRKLAVGQSAARKKNSKLLQKQNVSANNVFLFKTLHRTPGRHICLIQAVILSFFQQFLRYHCRALQ